MQIRDRNLMPVWEKIQRGERLTLEDGLRAYTSGDLIGLGAMAHAVQKEKSGDAVYFVLNQKIEPTNVCVLACKFCDFATRRGRPNAYEMTIDEMVARCSGDVSEIHISGGMPPEWTLDNYLQIVRALRQAYPNVGIKAFTAVEVEWAARIAHWVLPDLEIFNVRSQIAHNLPLPDGYLLWSTVHGLGWTAFLLSLSSLWFSRRDFV